MFHVLQAGAVPTEDLGNFGTNNLDHFDGQTFDTDPFSEWVGPYIADPNDPLSPAQYEHPVRLYSRIEGPYAMARITAINC